MPAAGTHHPRLSHRLWLVAPHRCPVPPSLHCCSCHSQCTLLWYRLVLKRRLHSWERPDDQKRGFPPFKPRKARHPHSTPGSALLWQPSHQLQPMNPTLHRGPCTGLTPLPWQSLEVLYFIFFFTSLWENLQEMTKLHLHAERKSGLVHLNNAVLAQQHPSTEDWQALTAHRFFESEFGRGWGYAVGGKKCLNVERHVSC